MRETEAVLSRTITPPSRIEHAPHCQGVAIIVLNPNREILLVQQRYEDAQYDRRPGQWNLVTETRKARKRKPERVRQTVQRALWEELGRTHDEFLVLNGTYRETNSVYTKQMGYRYFYRCLAVQFIPSDDKDPNELFSSYDGEIAQFAWVSYDRLHEYDIEYGARLVLDYYQNEFNI